MSNEELVERIKQGENSLMSDLYMNCRRFIIAIIKRIGIEQAEDCEDAMQDAYFGLYEAVKGFDESKGYKFLTYAKYHIQTAIQRGKLKSSDLPEYVYSQRRQILRKRSELMQSLGRYPTQAELALKMNMNVKTVNYILNVSKPIKSIYESVEGTDELIVSDTIPDNRIDFENTIVAADERACVRAVVEELPEAEKEIIKLSYFEGLPYSVIAQQINKSVERVRQLKQRGLRQLRHPRMSKRLLDEDIDRRTSFYNHRGVSAFNTTWTSSTEQTVLQREYFRKRLEERGTVSENKKI